MPQDLTSAPVQRGRKRIAALFRTRALRHIADIFKRAGYPVRLVGGAVRDVLHNRPLKDIDLATPAPPETAMRLLTDAGVKVIPTGIKHGTITAIASGQTFEITTLRRDVETDGRWAVVAFSDSWEEDAARRDFTINAMSADPDGTLHDYFGGLDDLLAHRVRFVGDPTRRLEEDVLRVLRYYRFEARYGSDTPDEAAVTACRAAVHRLPALSAERVRAELLRILETARAAAMWRRMEEDGVLSALGLLPVAPAALEHLMMLEGALGESADPLRHLIAACPRDPPAVAELAERLRLSNAERARWQATAAAVAAFSPTGGPKNREKDFLYQCGTVERYRDAMLLVAARGGWTAGALRAAQEPAGDTVPVFPIAGRDLTALGLGGGPLMGQILKGVERWWRDAGFLPDRHACLEEARERIKSSAPERSA